MKPIPQARNADIVIKKRLWIVIAGAKEKGCLAIMNVCRIGRLITYLYWIPIQRVPCDDHRYGEGRSQWRHSPLVPKGTVEMSKRVDDACLKQKNVDAAKPQNSPDRIFERCDDMGG